MFFKYLNSKKRIIFAPFLFGVIFAVTFYFYGIPKRAIIYPLLLCFFILIFFIAFDYFILLRKYKELNILRKTGAEIIEELPETICILDEEYKNIIKLLIENQRHTAENFSENYDDMIEYYTVWAHQIKTPIASMRLTLQNEDSPLSINLKNDLTRIENYVQMVLAFLRLDSPSTDYIISEYSLDKIIKESVKKFSGVFISKKLSLNFTETNKKVLTDEKWLAFVVEQLISNALKYTENGGISIYLEEGDILCIEDSGIGILKTDLPRIFEKGYTGSIGRTDKKASGIGLYLCKRICDNLCHEISIFSEVGVGTTVKINLKRYDKVPE